MDLEGTMLGYAIPCVPCICVRTRACVRACVRGSDDDDGDDEDDDVGHFSLRIYHAQVQDVSPSTIRSGMYSKVRWPELTMEGRLCSTTSFPR